jgi:hypothetical protein
VDGFKLDAVEIGDVFFGSELKEKPYVALVGGGSVVS